MVVVDQSWRQEIPQLTIKAWALKHAQKITYFHLVGIGSSPRPSGQPERPSSPSPRFRNGSESSRGSAEVHLHM